MENQLIAEDTETIAGKTAKINALIAALPGSESADWLGQVVLTELQGLIDLITEQTRNDGGL